jgi:hypothetical protein
MEEYLDAVDRFDLSYTYRNFRYATGHKQIFAFCQNTEETLV